MIQKRLAALTLVACAMVVMTANSVRAEGIAPHKAVYKLLPGPQGGQTPYDGVDGVVTRSVERTCDGCIVAEHMIMRVMTRIGGVIDREIRFTSWESDDGTSYRFAATIESKAGDENTKLNGRLTVPSDGAAGTAVYQAPQGKTVEVPAGTYLPVSHLRKFLAEARAGKKQVQFHVFDGTEENGPELMSAIVTGRFNAGEGKGMRTSWGPLGTGPGWQVSAAFFETTGEQPKSTPGYQMAMELLDNGVPRRMEMDIGGFVIVQALEEVQPIPAPSCN